MQKANINVSCDAYTSLEDAIFQQYIANKYSAPLINLSLKENKFDDFINDLKKEFKNLKVNKLELNAVSKFIYLESDNNFFIELVYVKKISSYNMNIYGNDYEKTIKVHNIMKKYETISSGIYLEVDTFSMSEQGVLNIKNDYKKYSDLLNVSKLYYPYLNTDDLFKKYSLSSESILLLIGKPGVGKTKLIALLEKFMFNNPELFKLNKDEFDDEIFFKIAYVKNTDILASDSFWDKLNENSYNIVFLDDADDLLSSRDNEIINQEDLNRKKFINQLLSFTDGIEKNETKFIITTNRSVKDIDLAILRKGRTFDILKLRELNRNEALAIWKENDLDENDFNELFKNDIILQSDLGSEIQMAIKLKELNENINDYVLENGISLLHTYKNKNKNIISF